MEQVLEIPQEEKPKAGVAGISMRMFELVQQERFLSRAKIQATLDAHPEIVDYAYILHEKDYYVQEDVEEGRIPEGKQVGDPKEPHWHIFGRFGKNPRKSNHIAAWFDVPEFCLNRVGKWVSALQYLTHANRPYKAQYEPDEVVSNYDFQGEIEAKQGLTESRRLEIMNGLVDGTIREFNYTDFISPIEAAKWKSDINTWKQYRVDKLMKEIEGAARHMEVVFISGQSGAGKSTFAKKMAADKGFSVYVSAGGKNPMDDYAGQDCVILDDLRGSTFKSVAELLKLLDNHTSSKIAARYRNKVLECQLVIITSTLTIDKFFADVFGSESEDIIQLKRRCRSYVTMTTDEIKIGVWDNAQRCYVYPDDVFIPNTVLAEFQKPPLSSEDALSEVTQMFGNVLDIKHQTIAIK